MRESSEYFNPSLVDRFNQNGERIDGDWRSGEQLTPLSVGRRQGRSKENASLLRDNLKRYVNEIDIIPNQEIYAFKH